MLKLIALAFGIAILGSVVFSTLSFVSSIEVSKRIVAKTVPYQLEGPSTRALLVLGDSTAVGVGAEKPEDTVAALLANRIAATAVENRAVSGATTADLLAQVKQASLSRYEAILIQIGANDIIRLRGTDEATKNLREALLALPSARKVFLMTAGDVGRAKLFPFYVRGLHSGTNASYRDAFQTVAAEVGVLYIDLYEDSLVDPFVVEPEQYFAKDGLHPSSKGYAHWFGILMKEGGL